MQAFVLKKYGKNSTLQLSHVAEPELQADEVLIRICAASVNLLDCKIKNGEFKPILPYRLPLVLGHDVAGVVLGVGAQVRQFKVGDEVYARPDDFRIGAFAERIAVKESALALKPSVLTMEQAASIPLVGLTAWQALVKTANIQKGQKIFIQAGSGGVGTFAIQLAKYLGAFVATTTSTANVEWVKNLGADVVIDYKKQDFATILHDYDVVLHSQDNAALIKSLSILKPQGQLISISGPPDLAFAQKIGAAWWLKLALRLLSFSVRRKAQEQQVGYSFLFMQANGQHLQHISRLIEAGVIRPVVDKVFPFAQTPEAMAYVETGRAKGKVVISM